MKSAVGAGVAAGPVFYRRHSKDGLYYQQQQQRDKKAVIDTLSIEGQQIANKMGDNLNLTEDGEVIYKQQQDRQQIGSSLLNLMEWFLNKSTATERPLDSSLFEDMIKESGAIHIPKKWKNQI